MERLPRRSRRIPHRLLTLRSARHGTRRRGELLQPVRSRIFTSSWPKNLSRSIAYLREDAAKSQRQLVAAQRDRLKLARPVPRLPRALSGSPLAELVPAHCRNLLTMLLT